MSDLRNEFVIGDDNFESVLAPVQFGERVNFGLVPRDYEANPVGSYNGSREFDPSLIELVDLDTLPEMIAEMEAKKTRLSDMYDVGNNGNPIPSLDQNGQGYCWSYSTACAIQAVRCKENKPYVQLSAHSVACVIKDFRDQGGWGAASLDFARERGYVPTSLWPAKSMSRQYNTQANWDVAKNFRADEGWIDLKPPVYDRDLSKHEFISCLIARVPVISDFNWWGHSVCAFDIVDAYPNRNRRDLSRYGSRIKNSWTDNWGTRGWGVLKDSKAYPDGATGLRSTWGT